MRSSILLPFLVLALSCDATPLAPRRGQGVVNDGSNPVVDLGKGGVYRGILQNNGTVQSWKGIPYATPPLGDLRFKPPTPLGDQSTDVVDVSDDALRCVQFGSTTFTGVKAGPGVEDCLKLWIWKPVSAKLGDKLPVMVYTHGGGLQNSAAANNDFSDWVGQEQNFIAVNVGYRLGGLGFFASEELIDEVGEANAGLLDMRLAYDWVKEHIGNFGGDGNSITIMGQSGGGLGIASQMILYDGKKPNFNRACARSIQRSAQFAVGDMRERNAKMADLLNCPSSESQLACFRRVSPYDIVNATMTLGTLKDSRGLAFPGFLPTNDGVTLTGTLTQSYQTGKIARLPFIGGFVTDESASFTPPSRNIVNRTTIGGWNLSDATIAEITSLYPINASYADPSGTGNFFYNGYDAVLQVAATGEGGGICSERLVNKGLSDIGMGSTTWGFRFNAPTVATNYGNATFPLAPVLHSSDNSYLQNATAVMTDFEKNIAYEWRAYIGSFIRTGNPNTQKLDTAPNWPSYAELDANKSPLRLVPTFHLSSNANKKAPTGTQVEVAARPHLERCDYWLSPEINRQIAQ